MGKGSSAPPAPDPYETAQADSQFNRADTYGADGSGVRYGYTDANGQFQQGVAPKGQQSAVSTVEGDFARSLRQMMEPAAQYMTANMIGQNVFGMPNAPTIQGVGGYALPGMPGGVQAPSTSMISQVAGPDGGGGMITPDNKTQRVQAPDNSMIGQVAAPEARNTQQIADDLYNRSFSLMRPAIEQQESRLMSNLQARGIPVGAEAFNETYGAQQREVNDTLSRLSMDANLAAGQEASRLYGIDMAGAQFQQGEQNRLYGAGQSQAAFRQGEQGRLQNAANQRAGFQQSEQQRLLNAALQSGAFQQGEQARLYGIGADQAQFAQNEGQRQFGNQGSLFNMALQNRAAAGDEQNRRYNLESADRGRALSELAGLMGGGYQPPSSVPSGNIAGVNYGGMVQQNYQNEMANWQQQQQNKMNTASTLGSLGSMLIKSSVHSKDMHGPLDTVTAAAVIAQIPLHIWSYKDDPDAPHHIGPTAQDFHNLTGLGGPEEISVIDYLGVLAGALQQALGHIGMLESEMRYRTGGFVDA